jgi:hypothetical protein
LNFFGLKVDRLFDLVEAAFLQAAVICNMRRDLDFLAVCVRLNGRVEARRGSAQLNV